MSILLHQLVLSLGLAAVFATAANACTIFVAHRNGKVLAGVNKDWFESVPMARFVPPGKDRCGMVLFGFANSVDFYGTQIPAGFPQGGMNERGLFFDCAEVERCVQILIADRNGNSVVLEPPLSAERTASIPNTLLKPDDMLKLIERFMSQCATVEEAVKLFEQSGAKFRLLRPKQDYQVMTNFRQSTTPPNAVACPRFKKANSILAEKKDISVDSFRSILRAVQQPGKTGTQYSIIFDLTAGNVYVYPKQNFDKVFRFNLTEELKKGRREIRQTDFSSITGGASPLSTLQELRSQNFPI